MTTLTDIGSLITQTPGICGGRLRIAGTGVSVRRIVGWYKLGLTPEEITTEIPHIDLAQVHAALAYYYEHQAEMDAMIAEQERLADQYKEKRIGSRHKPLSG